MARAKSTKGSKKGGGQSRKRSEAEQPQIAETTMLFPEASVVQKLAKAKLAQQKANSVSSGELGQKIGKAVDTDHLDRKAFGIATQFLKMFDNDPERAAVTYYHTLRYLNDLDIPNKAKEHRGMFAVEETGPGAGEKEQDAIDGSPGQGDSNVTHIGAAARRVNEAAGAKPN